MNPFATSLWSVWAIPKSFTWSPARTVCRVHGLSLVTSTRTVSPGLVSTMNSRDDTAATLPSTRQRSSPPEGSGATATCGAGGGVEGAATGGGVADGTAVGGIGVVVCRGSDDGSGAISAGGGTLGITKLSAESPGPTTTAAISCG